MLWWLKHEEEQPLQALMRKAAIVSGGGGCECFPVSCKQFSCLRFKNTHFEILPSSIPLSLQIHVCPPGGAISNMYAMLLARFKMFPEVKEKGMSSVPRLVAFTSEHVRPPRLYIFLCLPLTPDLQPSFVRLSQKDTRWQMCVCVCHIHGCLLHRTENPIYLSSCDLIAYFPPLLFCQSHFSIKKGAAALGIGTESVICIKADEW